MYEIGSYVYLRKGSPLYDPATLYVIHAVPSDSPPVSILGDIESHNGQTYVPITNPFGTTVQEPINPYQAPNELRTVLVHTDAVRDPSEVVGAMLPAVAGGGWTVDARTGVITKAEWTAAISGATWVALGLTAAITALMMVRNPQYKFELLTAGAGLSALALYKNFNKQVWQSP